MEKEKNPKQILKNLEKEVYHDINHDNLNEEHISSDHYHGNHHFDELGNHDDILEEEYSVKNIFSIKAKTKKQEILKISLAGVFLAFAVVFSIIEAEFATFLSIPINGVWIETTFLSTIVLLLSLSVVGIWYSLLISIIQPWFHLMIHSEHTWFEPFIQMVANIIIMIATALVYYVVFKNSPYHKDPIKSRDLFKRISPAVILTLIAALITTLMVLLMMVFNSNVGGHNHMQFHEHSDKEFISGMTWSEFKDSFAILFFAILGINILRFSLAFILFVIIEGKMRTINHRYK